MKNFILNSNLITTKHKINPHIKKMLKGNSKLNKTILEYTNFLPVNYTIEQRLFCIMHDITSTPKCKKCNNNVGFRKYSTGFSTYCSSKCLNSDDLVKSKRKKTNLEKYGFENVILNDEIKQKRKNTNLLKYGAEYPFQNKEVLFKTQNSLFDNFGVYHGFQSKTIQGKISQNVVSKYGSKCAANIPLSESTLKKLTNYEWMYNEHILMKKSLTTIADEIFCSKKTVGRYLNIVGIEIQHYNSSNAELQIIKYIKECTPTVKILHNDRALIRPKEIDIYLPELNLAIEYDGIYYHSELYGMPKNYHAEKTQLCENKNVRLVHIFENEWKNKQNIVRGRLCNLLKINDKIYARKCKIKELSSLEISNFLNTNHMQGTAQGAMRYGLIYDNEIVAAMSFCKSRFNKKYEYELLRYANKLNFSVVGGASKLLKYFLRTINPNSIISYSDRRWNTGGLYYKLGFYHLHRSNPNCFYFYNGTIDLLSRLKFQKHKQSKLLDQFDPQLSAWENMINNNYNRIWDCGNDVFVWRK